MDYHDISYYADGVFVFKVAGVGASDALTYRAVSMW
jgi:hypothetical protein